MGGQDGFLSITAFHTNPSLEKAKYIEPWIKRIHAEELRLPYATWEPEVQQLLQVRSLHP